jgi:hypothetical protein
MFRILITDDIGRAGLTLLEPAADVHYDVVKLPGAEKLLQVIGDYDAVITRSGTPLTAPVFEAARRLKVAGRAGVGLDNIDIDAATRRGVLVMNSPGGNTLRPPADPGFDAGPVPQYSPGERIDQEGEWTRANSGCSCTARPWGDGLGGSVRGCHAVSGPE